jgi:hypothetical protein
LSFITDPRKLKVCTLIIILSDIYIFTPIYIASFCINF